MSFLSLFKTFYVSFISRFISQVFEAKLVKWVQVETLYSVSNIKLYIFLSFGAEYFVFQVAIQEIKD